MSCLLRALKWTMTRDSSLQSPVAVKTMLLYEIFHTVLMYMSSRLPKLELTSLGFLYNQQREKHLHRLMWGMETRPCSVLPSRGRNLLRGGKAWPGILFSLNCTKVTSCYWQLCNQDVTTESATLLTQSKKNTFWCLNKSLSHSESDSHLLWKNLLVKESVLPGRWQLLCSLSNTQMPSFP